VNALVTAARALAAEIASGESGRDFEHLVAAFSHEIAKVPDFTPAELTAADLDALRTLADEVVETIEGRLENQQDRGSVRRKLADLIYRIRRHQEEIDTWRRHFGVA